MDEWRLVGISIPDECPFMSKLKVSRPAASDAKCAGTPRTKSDSTRPHVSKCPVMQLLFILSSMLPSASAVATTAPTARRAPPRSAVASPASCAACPTSMGPGLHLRMSMAAGVHSRATRPMMQLTNGHVAPDWGDGSQDGSSVLVLGAGWVGSRLARRLHEDGSDVHVTHRPSTIDPDAKDDYFRPVPLPASIERHRFDLADPESWSALPPASSISSVVITFPLNLPAAENFWETYLRHVPRVVCYSSTSVYQVDFPGQRVNEATALKNSPRALAESFLQERGATILTIAGIFGEPRGPRGVCRCLSAYLGSGGAPNGRKSVNMVHEADIVDATCACLHKDAHGGDRLNIGGEHFLLQDLVSHCKHPAVPDDPDVHESDLSSKRVCSQRLLEEVMPDDFSFSHPMGQQQEVEAA